LRVLYMYTVDTLKEGTSLESPGRFETFIHCRHPEGGEHPWKALVFERLIHIHCRHPERSEHPWRLRELYSLQSPWRKGTSLERTGVWETSIHCGHPEGEEHPWKALVFVRFLNCGRLHYTDILHPSSHWLPLSGGEGRGGLKIQRWMIASSIHHWPSQQNI
jgi:hypothetical protein